MRCTWCLGESGSLTRDHVIPRSIGGTPAFSVPACEACQSLLSKLEHELSRKSILAIHALCAQPRPRHPGRPTSGLLQPLCLLVKNPLGGYGESTLRSGERIESLPHVEIKVVLGEPVEARVRATTWEESERIFSVFRSALIRAPGPDGLVCEIKVSLEVPPPVAEDADFWPRLILLPTGQLLIRARDGDEARRFAMAMTQLALNPPPRPREAWRSSAITGGTVHHLALQYDARSLRKVATKIAYGVVRCATNLVLREEDDVRLRTFILGSSESALDPVTESALDGQLTTGIEFHFVVIAPPYDRTAAIVSLYGHPYRVHIGSTDGSSQEPVVLRCATDGTGMTILSPSETLSVLDQFRCVNWMSISEAHH